MTVQNPHNVDLYLGFTLNKLDRLLVAHADHDKVVFQGSLYIPLMVGSMVFLTTVDVNISTATNMDAGAVAAGTDYCVYACNNAGSLVFLISLNTTVPAGYDAAHSRKIGGFHTLCVNVGAIGGHPLTGYVANDILPASIWDLKHRPRSNPGGMVFVNAISKWVDIYLMSGTGVSTASVNGGVISDTRDWMDFVDDAAAVSKRLLKDDEFQAVAEGSNQQTNIAGSADPVTTGGHSDTAGRRMISNYGLEDCCGAMWQWLLDQSYQCNPDGTVTAAALTFTVKFDAAPGGNPIYLKQSAGGMYYLCSNLATAMADKYIGPTSYKIPIKYDAAADVGAIGQLYFNDTGTQPARLLCNISTIAKDIFIISNNITFLMQIKHDAAADVNGKALYYDDGADNRLECNNTGGVDALLDLALNSQVFSYYTLPGSKGRLYRQGTYGDVKLRAGGCWVDGTNCGSRARYAAIFRWLAYTVIGGRALSDPL